MQLDALLAIQEYAERIKVHIVVDDDTVRDKLDLASAASRVRQVVQQVKLTRMNLERSAEVDSAELEVRQIGLVHVLDLEVVSRSHDVHVSILVDLDLLIVLDN